MNESMFFKSLKRYGINFKEFLEMATINNFITYKGLVDFCHKHKEIITSHFTFKLRNEWYRVDIDEKGVYLSVYKYTIAKPMNKFFVTFEDYLPKKDIYPSPILIEENYKDK